MAFAIPFDVVLNFTDGSAQTLHQTPAVWQQNQKSIFINIKTTKKLSNVILENGLFMDATPIDNKWVAN